MNELPVIGITMGDPSGIGPEIIIKALSDSTIHEICRPLIIGDPGAFEWIKDISGTLDLNEISSLAEAKDNPGRIDILTVSRLDKKLMIPGKPTIEGGDSMVGFIKRTIDLALGRDIAAMVTCPMNKALMQQAGHIFAGHTQLISHHTDTKDYIMMLAGKKLRVALVTIHCALKDVPDQLNKEDICKTIIVTSRALHKDFGIKNPRLAVAALNPHAGESGLFGDEEEEIIKPAVRMAENQGYSAEGPFPADTIFHKAASGQFDAVISMYHDQGLIPLKLLHFSDAVNITLGLPIIRTSVDHGTAYDIAGKDIADPSSLKAAVRMAVRMDENQRVFE